MLGVWKFTKVADGELFVMMAGTSRMPKWSADSWGVEMQCRPQETLISAPALAPSPWMTWRARGRNPLSGSAGTEAGSPITVATVKMLESFAQFLLSPPPLPPQIIPVEASCPRRRGALTAPSTLGTTRTTPTACGTSKFRTTIG